MNTKSSVYYTYTYTGTNIFFFPEKVQGNIGLLVVMTFWLPRSRKHLKLSHSRGILHQLINKALYVNYSLFQPMCVARNTQLYLCLLLSPPRSPVAFPLSPPLIQYNFSISKL